MANMIVKNTTKRFALYLILELCFVFMTSCISVPSSPRMLTPNSTEEFDIYAHIESIPSGAQIVTINPDTKVEKVIGTTPYRFRLLVGTFQSYSGMKRAGLPARVCQELTPDAPCTLTKKTYSWTDTVFLVVAWQSQQCQVLAFEKGVFNFSARKEGYNDTLFNVEVQLSPPPESHEILNTVVMTRK